MALEGFVSKKIVKIWQFETKTKTTFRYYFYRFFDGLVSK